MKLSKMIKSKENREEMVKKRGRNTAIKECEQQLRCAAILRMLSRLFAKFCSDVIRDSDVSLQLSNVFAGPSVIPLNCWILSQNLKYILPDILDYTT